MSNISYRIFSIPFWLFLVVIISKLFYLYYEFNYNLNLLDTASDFYVSEQDFRDLEKLGHNISAVGVTLLVMVFAYKMYAKIISNSYIRLTIWGATLATVYLLTYNGLIKLMDYIVESNMDKGYPAYYTNLVKFAMLDKNIKYDDYIPFERIANNNLTTSDKVIFSNIILLSFADEEVIDRMIKKGKDALIQTYISKNPDKFKASENDYNDVIKKIESAWKEHATIKSTINKKSKNADSKAEALRIFNAMHSNLIDPSYGNYQKAIKNYEKNLQKHYSKTEEYYADLKKYFRYQKHSKAQNEYRKKMNSSFGKYIEPSRFCLGETCPSREAIKKVIKEESDIKYKNSMFGKLPKNLSKYSFMTHPETLKAYRDNVAKNYGIVLPTDYQFNNTHKDKEVFINSYSKKVGSAQKSEILRFQKEFESKTGISNMPLDISWEQFVYKFKPELLKNGLSSDRADRVLESIALKQTTDFYNNIYLKEADIKLNEFMFSKNQLSRGGDKEQEAKNSLKTLFIPPFAIVLSMMVGFLNFITLLYFIVGFLTGFINEKLACFVSSKKVIFSTLLLVFAYFYYEAQSSNKNIENLYGWNEGIMKDFYDSIPLYGKLYIEILDSIVVAEEYINKIFIRDFFRK